MFYFLLRVNHTLNMKEFTVPIYIYGIIVYLLTVAPTQQQFEVFAA